MDDSVLNVYAIFSVITIGQAITAGGEWCDEDKLELSILPQLKIFLSEDGDSMIENVKKIESFFAHDSKFSEVRDLCGQLIKKRKEAVVKTIAELDKLATP